eukprot:Polyplicarium_translucidae@DN4721_c0_g1_i1.p2
MWNTPCRHLPNLGASHRSPNSHTRAGFQLLKLLRRQLLVQRAAEGRHPLRGSSVRATVSVAAATAAASTPTASGKSTGRPRIFKRATPAPMSMTALSFGAETNSPSTPGST